MSEMSEEKITGVCVDIPTVIAEAKAKKEPLEWRCKIDEITFDASNLNDAEKFLIEKGCELAETPVPTLANIRPDYYKKHRFVLAPEWISVTDRLPEEGVSVLGWDSIHYYEARLMQHEKDLVSPYTLEFYVQDSQGTCMIEPMIPITHWMPLPDPPKR